MQRFVLLAAAAIAAAFMSFGAHAAGAAPRAESGIVASVYDGDTLTLTSGQRVRLLQIDTPELGSGECYSRAARTALLGPRSGREPRHARGRPSARSDRSLRAAPALRPSRPAERQPAARQARCRSSLLLRRRHGQVRRPPSRGGATRESGEARPLECVPAHRARPVPGDRHGTERSSGGHAPDCSAAPRAASERFVRRELLELRPESRLRPRLQGHRRPGQSAGSRRPPIRRRR